MIKCSNCSFENPDLNKFCQNCGTEITANIMPISEMPMMPILENEEAIKPEIKALEISAEMIDPANNPINPATNENDENNDPPLIPTADLASNLAIDLTTDPAFLSETSVLDQAPEDITAPELLPPILTNLRYAGFSDVGREREHNEDGFRCFTQTMMTESHGTPEFKTQRGLFLLCDGMGGHAGGDIACAMALELIAESFKPFWTSGLPGREKLKEIITIANQAIYDRNEQELRREIGRMGTTLVLLIIYGTEVAIAHVGDSRIYKITADTTDEITDKTSENRLIQLTRDHEVGNKLIDQGLDEAIAFSRPDAHQLTQALGPNSAQSIEPSIEFFSLESTTLFLLCSDGLSDNQIVEAHWQNLTPLLAIDSDLKVGVKNLVQLGNDLNGYDNITAVLVHCQIDTQIT